MSIIEGNIVISGASSDIGMELARAWSGIYNITGTYRTLSDVLHKEKDKFVDLFPCDFSNKSSIDICTNNISQRVKEWDILVMCPATMEPIGAFSDCNIDEWEKSIQINLIGQLRFVHQLLPACRVGGKMPKVIFFAGGGTNSAPLNFSAYTISKIALIKAVELLDAEMPDLSFSILGPGWVHTKIHEQTIKAGDLASNGAASVTQNKIKNDDFVPMAEVIACCNWLINSPKSLVGGRNFSVAHDFYDRYFLEKSLESDNDMFKLRRSGNNIPKKHEKNLK